VTASPEAKHTYDVDERAAVPALHRLTGVAKVSSEPEVTHEAVYHDTRDLALARAGFTLRSRASGDDEGWRLTLPLPGGEREEVHAPLEAATGTVPRELRSLVQVRARGRDLAPVATVRTRRVVHRLLGEDDTVLARLADDHVTSEAPDATDGVTVSSWREWELTLVAGPRRLLKAGDRLATDAGARPSTTSPLARALGERFPPARTILEREPSKKGPAAVVVHAQLRDQVEELESRDPGVRRDLPDALHKMRVASRRLRSALTSFGPLLDRQTGDTLRSELKWVAEVLGEARDAEVMRDRLTSLAGDQAIELGRGSSADLESQLGERYRQAHARVLEVLDSPRYFRLLDDLDQLLGAPPWTAKARKPARQILPARARREWKLLEGHAKAAETATGEQRDVELHEVRKAAKRLRYACEALVPAFGDPAADMALASERLQEVLGDHQDSVVSQELLRELATRSEVSGDDALVLGRLHHLEQTHAEHSEQQYQDVWERLSRRGLRRWMRR